MANENVIQATFDGFYKTYTEPSWLIDHGMELSISGIDLPDEFECHFSNSRSVAAKRQIGENGVVTIPDEYFLSNAAQIFCWIYLHPTVDSGVTEYEIVIPLRQRPNVDPSEPTQEQQDIVDQAIAALNVAMAETSADAESASASATAAQAAVDSVLNMTVSADTLPSGSDASVTKSVVDDAVHLAFGIPQGAQGVQGEQGVQGPTGATPNFTIGTVQTLLPTQDATATITGTAEAPVLNLGIPKGYSGDATNLAADYSSNKIYAVGEYCIYNGSLYRCITAITTAEAWTAAHWTAAVIGNDVSDLKSAFSPLVKDVYNTLTENVTTESTVIFPYLVYAGKSYTVKNETNASLFLHTRLDSASATNIDGVSLNTTEIGTFTATTNATVIAVYCNATSGTFTISLDDSIVEQTNAEIQTLETKVGKLEDEAVGFLDDGVLSAKYIHANGNQYINTGIPFAPTTGIEVDFIIENDFISDTSLFGAVFGSRIASQSSELSLSTYGTNGLFRYGTSKGNSAYFTKNVRYKMRWVQGVYTLVNLETGVTVRQENYATNITASNNVNIILFAQSTSGTINGLAKMTLYSAKIYSGSTIIANFVPAKMLGGEFGLYDTIGGDFYADVTGYGFDGELTIKSQTLENEYSIEKGEKGTVFDAEVKTTIESVQTILASSGVPMLTFAVFTDLHHDPKYPLDPTVDMFANIRTIYERLHFDGLINLGDAIDGQYQTQYEAEGCLSEVVTEMYNITAQRSHNLIGNHDDNVQSTWDNRGGYPASERLTTLEIYDALFKGSVDEAHNPNHLTDYYVDYEQYGIRVICVGIDYVTYNAATQTWLANVALNTDKPVLVFSHCATKAAWGYQNDIQHGEYIEIPLNNFVSGGGTVIALIHGHTHGDMIETDSSIDFTEVAIGCAKFETMTSGTTGITYQPRNATDYTKILFDMVCIDQTNRKAHFIRCGAGTDREISY